MNINKERLIFLLNAYTKDEINDEQLIELSKYVSNADSDPVLNEMMEDFWNSMRIDQEMEIPKNEIFQKITEDSRFKITPTTNYKIRTLFQPKYVLRYAAAVLLVVGAGVVFYFYQHSTAPKNLVAIKHHAQKTILPGGKKAILTLSDGSEVILGDTIKTTLALQGNTVLEQESGKLTYKSMGSAIGDQQLKNIITTPKGGEYQLVLPDGTKVWLNTASRLSYPVVFNGAERRVTISGEAYFEVARNPKMPFIIEANGTEIGVLGTHFNVTAYNDDNLVKTTLLEGSVKVSKNKRQVILKPDQQAVVSNSSEVITVVPIDGTEALAWKNGYFLFNNEDIETVMKVIARWYDIEVEYRGNMKGKAFGGTISRFSTFEKLLKTLELTEDIHFKIEGRRVIVMP